MKLSCIRNKEHVKLLVAGGGAAGSAVSNYFARRFGPASVAIVDGQQTHYYQAGFTLVGSNLISPEKIVKKRADYLPKGSKWYAQDVHDFQPEKNMVTLKDGTEIEYDLLVIALGLDLRYDMIKGLPEGFNNPRVSSIYKFEMAQKTRDNVLNFNGGRALFTFPPTTLKCAGAPLKICFTAEDTFRANGVRDRTEVVYNTPTGKIFGVEKYAKVLDGLAASRGIKLNKRHNLIEVDSKRNVAIFDVLDNEGKSQGKKDEIEFDLLHVGPPCSPMPSLLKHKDIKVNGKQLTDAGGWVKVNKLTLQTDDYSNVFAIGDCANTPNGKTAAAISSQFKALKRNVSDVFDGKQPSAQYDGYASCPLLVDHRHVVLAEFNADGPLETMPIDQSKPRYSSFLMKRYLMKPLYYDLLCKGYWTGPETIRKILHLGFSK